MEMKNWNVSENYKKEGVLKKGIGTSTTLFILIFALGLLNHLMGTSAWADQTSGFHSRHPLSEEEKQEDQRSLADYQKKLDEYHQGKRDKQDGYVILWHMGKIYAREGRKDDPAAQLVIQEYKALLQKHPEFKKMTTLELHEARDQSVKEQAEMAVAQTKAATFKPSDTQVSQLFGSGHSAMALYQYKLEFYHLPDNMEIKEAHRSARLFKNNQKIQNEGIQQIKPFKVITFSTPFTISPLFPNVTLSPVWICQDFIRGYSPETNEEQSIARVKGGSLNSPIPWTNKSADNRNFCGEISIIGDVLYQLPLQQSYPDRLIKLVDVSNGGKKAYLVVGERITVQTDEGTGYDIGNLKKMLVWDYPNQLKSVELPTHDPEVQGLLKGWGLQ